MTNPARAKPSRDKKTRKQIVIRAFVYIAATHLWAAFIVLLFELGAHR